VYSGSGAYGGAACPTTGKCRNWLNPASFSVNPVGTYGNVVKGAFRGPGYADWDVSAARNFPITERTSLQLRAEYFNFLNHTNLGDPGTGCGGSAAGGSCVNTGGSFGRITSTSPQNWSSSPGTPQNDPRIAQFSMKVLF